MKRLIAAVFVLFGALPLHAQQGDYSLLSYMDLPREFSQFSRATPLVIHGWAFECRSGLQPATQRVGDIAVAFTSVQDGSNFTPKLGSVKLLNTKRPDVGLAFQGACPVGENAGYALIVSDLPPRGGWYLKILVATWDGRNQVLTKIDSRWIVMID